MKKKMRKFSEGGFETTQGENENITSDTRERALKSVEGASDASRDLGTPVTRSAPKIAPKASQATPPAKKAPVETPEEYKDRMEGLTKKQALVNVHPEDYLPSGMLKPMLRKVVQMGAKRAENAAAESVARNATRKAEEGFNPSEALDALKPTRNLKGGTKDIPIKQGTPKFETPSSGVGKEVTNKAGKKIPIKRKSSSGEVDDGGSGAFKRGGAVRSSASRRADGCAIRGKTRA